MSRNTTSISDANTSESQKERTSNLYIAAVRCSGCIRDKKSKMFPKSNSSSSKKKRFSLFNDYYHQQVNKYADTVISLCLPEIPAEPLIAQIKPPCLILKSVQ